MATITADCIRKVDLKPNVFTEAVTRDGTPMVARVVPTALMDMARLRYLKNQRLSSMDTGRVAPMPKPMPVRAEPAIISGYPFARL